MSQFPEKTPNIIVARRCLSSDIPGERKEMLENVRKPTNPYIGTPSNKPLNKTHGSSPRMVCVTSGSNTAESNWL